MLDSTYYDVQSDNSAPKTIPVKREICGKPITTFKRSHNKHRNKVELIADILKASRNCAITKTKIMRTCYISYNLMQKYLRYSVENGLVFGEPRSNRFQITRKGMQYLTYFEQYRDTESQLAIKKKAIFEILDKDKEPIINPEQLATAPLRRRY